MPDVVQRLTIVLVMFFKRLRIYEHSGRGKHEADIMSHSNTVSFSSISKQNGLIADARVMSRVEIVQYFVIGTLNEL